MTARPHWVSWYTPATKAAGFEMHCPWWISGHTGDGKKNIVVASIVGEDWDRIREEILACYDDPSTPIEWRFCEAITEKGDRPGAITPDEPWTGPDGRFPHREWHVWPWTGKRDNPA